MGEENGNNEADRSGAVPQELSKEEISQWIQENIAADVDAALTAFTQLPSEARSVIAKESASEQMQILNTVLPTYFEEAGQKYPTIVVYVKGPEGTGEGQLAAAKHLTGLNDPGGALNSAFVLALLYSPVARALLRVHGYMYHFAQTKELVQSGLKKIVV